jgi:hypothetical protein
VNVNNIKALAGSTEWDNPVALWADCRVTGGARLTTAWISHLYEEVERRKMNLHNIASSFSSRQCVRTVRISDSYRGWPAVPTEGGESLAR